MPLCRFWQKGFCREGDNCRFEHRTRIENVQQNRNQGQGRGQPRTNDQNRFATLGGHSVNYQTAGQRSQNRGGGAVGGGPGRGNQPLPRDAQRYELEPNRIAEDLGPERPEWIMSAYGPGKDPPVQLFGGFPLEQSPEEIRVLHYLNVVAGNPQQSAQQEQELAMQANKHAQTALNDPDGAVRYILDGLKTRPNRKDQCGPRNTPGYFSREARRQHLRNSNRNPRSLTNATIQPSSAFGGQQAATGFGGTTAVHNQAGNSVAQLPQVVPANNVQIQQPMIQQQPISTESFQQGPFAPQNPQQPGLGAFSNFGSGFNGNQPPFGASSSEPTLPSAPSQSQGTGFGSAFASQAGGSASGNGFGQNGQMNGASFNEAPFNGIPASHSLGTGFGHAPNMSSGAAMVGTEVNIKASLPDNSSSLANTKSYSTRAGPNGKLVSWKGKPVEYLDEQPCYRTESGFLQRIYFPDGYPGTNDSNWPKDENDWADAVSKNDVKDAYRIVRESGTFKEGLMPEIAPSPDLCRWDV